MLNSIEAEAVINDARRTISRSKRVNAEFRRRIARLRQIERLTVHATDGSELRWLADQFQKC